MNDAVYLLSAELENFFAAVLNDGVGFDPARHFANGKAHIGIENVRERLHTMMDKSEKGRGTDVWIHIPKQEGQA